MKAIVIDSFGEIDLFQEKDLPIPKPGRGEVRVKLRATGFNPVDFKIRKGLFGGEFPLVLGVDFSGVVDAVGDLVRDFSVGDGVFGIAFGPCSNGSYAEYLCVAAQFIAKKPKALSFEEAAGVPVTYLTAFQSLVSKGALQKDRPIFLTGGSGGVGSAALALAKVYETGPVFTMAGSEESVSYITSRFSIP
ncbi:MAG: Zinc-type alcohol dehydrogenase-like protein, partial [Chlamydiae bacterium]|nr:Zinc-type alcohol dehydrogenase-like protein [Chlamydiota bacterium]